MRGRDVILALAVSAVVAVAVLVGWLRPLERPLSDLFQRVEEACRAPEAPIAVVAIDEPSIAMVAAMPWPRDRLAQLIEMVWEHEPKVVVLDILLAEPRDPQGDSKLAQTLERGPHVLAAVIDDDGRWVLPLETFGGKDVAAHAHAETASDGVVRSIAYTKQDEAFSLEALSVAAVRAGGWRGRIYPGRRFRPDFAQSPGDIPRVSAVDVMNGEISAPDPLRDRIVFIGYTAAGTTDQFMIPAGPRNHPTPGVLVHAAVSSSLLRGGLLTTAPLPLTIVLLFLAALIMQVMRNRSGRFRVGHAFLATVAIGSSALLALWFAETVIPAVALVFAALLSAGVREAMESKTAQAETGRMLSTLLEEESERSVAMPRGVPGRLEMVRRLQESLARDRNLRRTLLEGLHEGIVLWDAEGQALMSNRAVLRLWGGVPSLSEIREQVSDAAGEPATTVQRGGLELEIEIIDLRTGKLGLFRDVSERAELERRRREMHRLVSHELKTPLASISGFGEMLQSYTMSGEELERVAGLIQGEADRLGEMVKVFLDIEGLGSERWDAERRSCDLATLVTARCRILESAATARGQRLLVEAEAGIVIDGVEQLLEQLVDNLVGNALKYAPEDSVIEVEVVGRSDGSGALTVRDQGPGIPEEAVPHLFERFYRVPGSEAAGSGLGLAFVKEVADRHGARIDVSSVVGRGSIFTVVFPAYGAHS